MHLLGPIRGKRVLELGCGAARWSIALARRGSRMTGLDLSSAQLAKAGQLQRRAGVRFPLVRGSAERLPFRERSFDCVFCDWGAMTFTDPFRSVPEVARVLRRGGRFVFSTWNPWHFVALGLRNERQLRRFVRPYFGLHRLDYGPKWAIEFTLPYGEWVALFRRNGLLVDRLIETKATPRDRSAYLSRDSLEWGRSWPLETIWSLVKE